METKTIGQNIIETVSEFEITLEARHFNNNVRNEIINYISSNLINKTYGVNYILNIDYKSILNNDLPLLLLNDSPYTYTYNIKLPVKYLYLTKNQLIEGYLEIDKDNTNNNIPIVIVHNKYIYCNILLDDNFTVNIFEKSLNYKNKEFKKNDKCIVKIKDIFSSEKNNKIICSGSLEIDE